MDRFINQLVDGASDILARRPGLLPMIGVAFILLNFLLQIFPGSGSWFVDSNLLLHLGLILGVVGLLLIRPLG